MKSTDKYEAQEPSSCVIKEITIRLEVNEDFPGHRDRVKDLFSRLYTAEQEWEEEMKRKALSVLREPAEFSVSTVLVDRTPQTGKAIKFSTDEDDQKHDLRKAERLAAHWQYSVVPKVNPPS